MKRLLFFPCTLFLVGAATFSVTANTASFQLTDLGNLAKDPKTGATFVSAVNARREVVGQSFDGQLHARAYLWRKGKMTDLGDALGALDGLEATAINKNGQIVGAGLSQTGVARAFFWDHNIMVVLPSLWTTYKGAYAWSINDKGEIVGAGVDNAGVLRALRWVAGIPFTLGKMSGGRSPVQAFDINEHGQIVGYVGPGGKVPYARAFSWKAGKFTDLGTLPGTHVSFANAVNDSGQIVGQSYDVNKPGTSRAFIWEEGTMLDLGMPASTHTLSEARAIGKKGAVVGTSGDGTVAIAWLWQNGRIFNLNKLIAASDPSRGYVTLTSAVAINDRNEITAEGIDRRYPNALRAYLMMPAKK